jgi:hypothetical protein
MDEEKNYSVSLLEEKHYMDEHMQWLIKRMAEAYEEHNSKKFELYKKNISSLKAVMNSRDRVISETQKLYILNFF